MEPRGVESEVVIARCFALVDNDRVAANRFPVKVGTEVKSVSCYWAKGPGYSETDMLKAWRGRETARQRDAVELARLAALRWEITCKFGAVASSWAEFQEAIHNDPQADVTAMLLAEASWFEPGLLGVCLFHRTWAGNLFLDFLAAHPETERSEARVSGVGIGLLYHVCEVAHHLRASVLWGETTALSAPIYRGYFGLAEVSDRLVVTPEQQEAFCRSVRARWESVQQS